MCAFIDFSCLALSSFPRQEGSDRQNEPSAAAYIPGAPAETRGARVRVLVIDDEEQMQKTLQAHLTGEGFLVEGARTGRQGMALVGSWHPDVVILDLSLPDVDGIEVCTQLRQWTQVPILVLSVREQDTEKVKALEIGADDYLTKPFSSPELVARIRVALRHAAHRAGAQGNDARFAVDGLEVDFATRHVAVEGREVRLTPTEYEVLKYLAMNAGRVLTHVTLLQAVWGPQYEQEVHYLHVFIGQLRRKIEPNPSRPRYLLTEPGVGYRLRSPL